MPHHNPPHATTNEVSGPDPIFVSVKEAARLLGLTPWSVYQLCNSGVLASGKDLTPTGEEGKRRLVSMASVKEYADRVLQGEAS